MANAEIKAVITAEDRASKAIKQVHDSLDGVSNVLKTGLKIGLAGAVAGFGALTAIGFKSVQAFAEAEQAGAQLNAVLKSTKGAAGVTAKQANELATSLQKVTKFSDEAVIGAQSMLLTFTKVGKDIFPQATETILDMSQALGQDAKSSAIQLGKALNDPINGITALRRVGVSFTEDQQKMIEKMVESGNIMGAQKLILQELQTEFGGSARAAGETFAGKLEILKNSVGDLQETIGSAIVTAITPFIEKITAWAQSPEGQEFIQNLTEAIGRFATETMPVVLERIGQLIEITKSVIGWFIQHKETIMNVLIPALTILIATFTALKIAAAIQGTIALVTAAIAALGPAAAIASTALGGPLLLAVVGVAAAVAKAVQVWLQYKAALDGAKKSADDLRATNSKALEKAAQLRAQGRIAEAESLERTVSRNQPFAHGGIVTQATNALIGERTPEAVIPLEQLDRMRSSNTFNISINGGGGGFDVDEMIRQLNRYTELQRMGGL